MVKKVDTKSTVPAPATGASAPANDTASPTCAIVNPGSEFGFKPGDFEALRIMLARPPKFPVGTTVPERVYRAILFSHDGISQFIEDAITKFDGDMHALVEAANQLATERKNARFDTGVRSISGRVPKAALTRLQTIIAALHDIPGMSLAKVLGGLVQIQLTKGDE